MKKKKENKENNSNLMSFDVYFSMLCSSNLKVRNYHKKAIEKFFKDKVGLVATKQQFDEVFAQY